MQMRRIHFLPVIAAVLLFAMTFSACIAPTPTPTPPVFKLITISSPASGGAVTPPSGGSYSKGVPVNLTAIPASGYRFNRWEGAASGSSPAVQLTMDGDKNLVAYFTRTYSLSASSSPGNGGTVVPVGGVFDEGTKVTLIASPAQYFDFKGWAGQASGTSKSVDITMDSNKQVAAYFEKQFPFLKVQSNPPDGGTIDPGSGTYEAGTQKTITATAAPGYRFERWSGDASGTSNPTRVVMDSDKNITANFTKVYTLTVASSPSDGGTINTKGGVYDAGTKVDLNATSTFPYYLKNWIGVDNNAVNPSKVTMDGDRAVTAVFAKATPVPLQKVSGSLHAGTGAGGAGPHPIDSIAIQLAQYEWVQGEIVVSTNPAISAFIKDPAGNVVKDFGAPGHASFMFMAKLSGPYTITFQNKSIFYGDYSLTYTVYKLPQ